MALEAAIVEKKAQVRILMENEASYYGSKIFVLWISIIGRIKGKRTEMSSHSQDYINVNKFTGFKVKTQTKTVMVF